MAAGRTAVELRESNATDTIGPSPTGEGPVSGGAEEKKRFDTQQRIVDEIVGLRRRLADLVAGEDGSVEERVGDSIADRYRDLVNSLSDVVVEIDAAARMMMVSPRAMDTLGYRPEELEGRPLYELLYPEEIERALRVVGEVVDGGGSRQEEFRIRSREGTGILTRATVVRSGGDARSMALVILTDISERERMAEALREREEKYRALFGASPDSIAVLDLHGRVLDGNDFYGVPPASVKGKHFKELGVIPPEYAELSDALWTALASGQRIGPEEMQIRGLDGQEHWLEVYAGRITSEGTPYAVQVISRDITVRKKLEEQLSQSQKMEAVGRLAGGVAHDFNNQLLVILNSAAILERSLAAGDARLEKVELIRRAAERSVSLTRQLLAFSRKQMIEPTVLDLNRLLTDLRPTLERVLGEAVALSYRLAEDLGAVSVDPVQMEQVLINLAANARDAMPEGGSLTVRTANLVLEQPRSASKVSLAAGQYVTLSVADTGPGMDVGTLGRVFDPFFTTKDPGKGTGLGLSTVYGVIKQSGGEIGVESEQGSGAVFTIYLPRVEGEPAAVTESRVSGEQATPGSRSILLIEDDRNVRETTRLILEDGGYEVRAAASAAEGLDLFGRAHGDIDMVLSDVVMPGMGIRELLQGIRRIEPGVKVLLVSGYSEQVVEDQGVAEPGVAFLNKPYTIDQLLSKVAEVLADG
jgi:two-component system cell cycle sensor histidine kinase/response regulator CckA